MENLGIASVAAITVITYLMGMAVRASRMDNKWIPILFGAVGVLLGLGSSYLLCWCASICCPSPTIRRGTLSPLRRWASSAVWRLRGCIRPPSS